MTLTSSSAPPLPGEADVLPDLMTGERLVGTGRFFAAFCVVFGTGILLMRECTILPSLAGERYRVHASRALRRRGRLEARSLGAYNFGRCGTRGAGIIRQARAPRDNAMAAADLPGSDEERAEAALIAAAGKILRSDNREVPEDFVAALFAHAVPEDLLRYDPRQLAELAADAWSLLAVRKPGVPKIRLNAPDLAGHERLRADSVLEIVNDDMPFLVDSVLAELAVRGLDVRFVVHPVLTVMRDNAGRLTAFKGIKPAAGALRESVIYVHIERIEEEARRAEIVEAIERVLADVRVCVHDWRAMMARVADVIAGLKADPPPLPAAEIEEAVAFLEWLADKNFTFLGVRDSRFTDAEEALEPVFETGLGIL